MRSSSPSVPNPGVRHELDSLMEAAGDVVFRLDPTGQIQFASQRAHTVLGASRPLLGAMMTTLATEVDQPALRNAIADAAASSEAARVEVRLKTLDKDT